MLNVNQLTAELARMPDQELQQYAAMHKTDPYTVALALSESNRRKLLRESAKPQIGQQPKVVDQVLASMTPAPAQLPENMGIGQLPAPNMETIHKAAGGIVAFNEGGDVPRYADTGLVQQTVPQALPGGLGIYSQGAFGPQAGDSELMDRIARIEANPRMRREDKDALIAQARQEFGLPKTTMIPPTQPVPFGKTAPAAAPTTDAASKATKTSPRIESDNVVDKALERKREEDAAAAANRKLPPDPGLPSINSYLKQYEGFVTKNAPTKETFMKEFADIDKPLVEKVQASIDKEGARLKTDKEQDFYMSLIQGGLAAAAEAGPNALQNIAKGFSVGASNYKEALKDFRKASQENAKMEIDLAKYQATGQKDALKSYYDAQGKRDDRMASGAAALLSQQMQTQGQMAVARMPGAQERLFTSLSDPTSAAYKGFKNYAEIMGPEAKGDTAIRTAAINKWSSEPMLRQEFNNDFNSYLRMMSGQQMISGATPKQLEYLKLYAPKGVKN